MSIIDTPPSPTQATATTTTKKAARVVVRKPNLDDKNNAIKEIDAKIDELRPRLVWKERLDEKEPQSEPLRLSCYCVHIHRTLSVMPLRP